MSQEKRKVRDEFARRCARRDKYRCVMCLSQACNHFRPHHITNRKDMPNGGYVPENGCLLCEKCHWKAEQFHISNGTTWEIGFHPNDLYRKIGSSYEAALEASKKL